MSGKYIPVVSDFSTPGISGVTAASKGIELLNMWNPVKGKITVTNLIETGYAATLAEDYSRIFRIGNLAFFMFHAELPAATTTATESVYCYTLPWAPPIMFKDYRNLGTNYIRSCVEIDTDGKVYFKQTGGHISHSCVIFFPIAYEINNSETTEEESGDSGDDSGGSSSYPRT